MLSRRPTLLLPLLLELLLLRLAACSALAVDGGDGLVAIVDGESGAVNVTLDNVAWLVSDSIAPATYRGSVPRLEAEGARATSSAEGGAAAVAMRWVSSSSDEPSPEQKLLPWLTEVLPGPVPGSLIFRQTWPQGFTAPPPPPPPSPNANATCGSILEGADQTGGRMCCGTPPRNGSMLAGFRGRTPTQCCDMCLANPQCNRYIIAEAELPTDPTCWLIAGAKGSYKRSGRSMGRIVGRRGGGGGTGPASDQDSVLAGWPAFENGAAELPLNLLGWGGCQLSPGHGQDDVGTHIARWTGGSPVASASGLTPFLLFDKRGRAAVMSPLENFFVGIHSTQQEQEEPSGLLQAGIKASVRSLPANFSHSTLIIAGHGITDTMIRYGDVLLAKSGKPRVDPYKDFILSHLGHWNDAGAYYYHNPHPFPNYQEALLAVKADAEARRIPFRYSQWDDWWAYQHGGDFGNDGGVTDWWPMPQVFPSGMTDWLGLPLSLYSSSYSGDNIYNETARYNWKVDAQKHALPVSRDFYDDIFANGTAAGMRMFEQDFLCSINGQTELTNQDVVTGQAWFDGMDAAAASANISLQMCMMNPVHTIATTLMHQVTNGRATRDNHPGQDRTSAGNGLVLGISGMLHFAMGIWPSRDNVWTNSSVSDHGGPEPMVETQTLMAFLSGGPYGPSDCAGCGNRSLIMRSCREDGVLLRADKPTTMLDSAFVALPFEGGGCNGSEWFDLTCEVINVWATHSDVETSDGTVRYGYVLGLDLKAPFEVTPMDILPATNATRRAPAEAAAVAGERVGNSGTDGEPGVGGSSPARQYRVWEYWRGISPGPDTVTAACDDTHPFSVPAAEANANRAVIVSGYYIMAPVLPNGWTYLGEPGKLVVASARRVLRIEHVVAIEESDGSGGGGGLAVCVALSTGETMTAFARSPDAKMHAVECRHLSAATGLDAHIAATTADGAAADDADDVVMSIRCSAQAVRYTP
jgi:hypothetical protein